MYATESTIEKAARTLIAILSTLGRVVTWYAGHARDIFASITGR